MSVVAEPQRTARRCFSGGTVPLLALAAWLGAASIAMAQALNPTGRTIELAVPVQEAGFFLGEVPLRITADDRLSVPGERFLELIAPLLDDASRAELEAAIDPDGRLDPTHITDAGLDFTYDPGLVEIRIAVPLDQRGALRLSLRPSRAERRPGDVLPARFSGFVNLRAVAEHLDADGNDDDGFRAPTIDVLAAARLGSVVLEGEALADLEAGRQGRLGTRLVYDDLDRLVRFRAGDVRMPATSFQAAADTLGVSIERRYLDLDPGRSTRPTGQRSFALDRTADVDLLVNGSLVRRFRLEPGNYDIRDFPLTAGANTVELLIEDDTGLVERLTFDLFFDSALLDVGLTEFALTGGVRSRLERFERDYDTDEWQVSGFVRRGVAEVFTLGANAQLDRDVRQAGIETVLATPIGAFALDATASHSDQAGAGAAAELDYRLLLGAAANGARRSLSASATTTTRDFASLGNPERVNPFYLDLRASYAQPLPLDIFGSFNVAYGFGRDGRDDRWRTGISARRQLFGIDFGVDLAYGRGGFDDGFETFLRASYRFGQRQSLRASYDSRVERSTLSYRRFGTALAGNYDLLLEAAHQPDDVSVSGAIGYAGNRGRLSLSHLARSTDLGNGLDQQRTRLLAEAAIAYADGAFAIGRPISGAFAIVEGHPSLDGTRIMVDPTRDGARAQTGPLGPALHGDLGSYAHRAIGFDVEDLPLGYDLGAGVFEVVPPYRAGYRLTVGSDYTVTAVGTLLDAAGEPIGLLAGTAQEADTATPATVPLFTNRAGRFGVQGLRPGRWQIVINTAPPSTFELLVPEGTIGLLRAGELRPETR